MNRSNPLKIKVRCPKNKRIYTMHITFAESQKNFPLPVNGCDDACGEEICSKCCAAITLMFYHGHDSTTLDVISPDLSVLK